MARQAIYVVSEINVIVSKEASSSKTSAAENTQIIREKFVQITKVRNICKSAKR
jgi:hypothetical protein